MPKAPIIRPQFNVGGLLDIPTGKYVTGRHGESILNSGLAQINSVVGPQNSFKTALLMYVFFTVFSRYRLEQLGVYDTEVSLSYGRLEDITRQFPRLDALDFTDESIFNKIALTTGAEIFGDEWLEVVKAGADARKKITAKIAKETPFPGMGGDLIKIPKPIPMMIDSLTQFKVKSVEEKIVNKNAVGESGANTQFMREAAAKAQMITQLPSLTAGGSILIGMVAHVGKKIVMDQYAPQDARLSHSKRGGTVKGVTEKFEFINNNLFEIFQAKPLMNSSSDKTAKYPMDSSDRQEGTVDLMILQMVNTRNKNGPSGFNFELIVSQTQGFQPSLTEFHYIKDRLNNYGVTGSNTSYVLDICPDVSLSRTTVRKKISESPDLVRALEITSQMGQMQRLWKQDEKYICTPKELYDDLKAKGYDWSVLLNTRGWWCFEEDAPLELNFLSTLDLLKMRTGEYHPYWMEPLKEK